MFCPYKTDANKEDFVFLLYEPLPYRDERNDSHLITKREVQAFVKDRFPNKQISEPMAIRDLKLEGNPLSNLCTFWYFRTEEENARSGQPAVVDEYLIDMHVVGYKPLDKKSSRTAITDYNTYTLTGYRIIKLATPLYTSFKTDFTERSVNDSSDYRSAEPLKYVGVPLE